MWSLALLAVGQSWPLTKAEASDYQATSSYEEVVAFLRILESKNSIRLKFIGESTERRKIPLVIVADPPVESAEEARKQGKLIVYVQGNIHAGEVEGKEAAMIYLRKLAQRRVPLGDVVLLVNPIYNADGNEKWGPVEKNRPEQDGPAMVGLRPNGQGFDLNRDCIKAESPEMQAALDHIYRPWDPDVVIDLHTTDGTRHGYDLTYSPPLHPNTPAGIREYAQEKLLPEVRRQINGFKLFDYGNAATREGARQWETFGWEGRYVTNYAGLANRVGILSEATVFLPFKDRIASTLSFVESCMWRLSRDKETIFAARANSAPASLGVRFKMAQGRMEGVLLEKPPGKREKKPDEVISVDMPVFDRFEATESVRTPSAYYLAPGQFAAVRLLRRHGIEMTTLGAPQRVKVEEFRISGRTQAAQAFQGHRLIRFEGTYESVDRELPAGTVRIPMRQRLWPLVFDLLEPKGMDGLGAWGFYGEDFDGKNFPVVRSAD